MHFEPRIGLEALARRRAAASTGDDVPACCIHVCVCVCSHARMHAIVQPSLLCTHTVQLRLHRTLTVYCALLSLPLHLAQLPPLWWRCLNCPTCSFTARTQTPHWNWHTAATGRSATTWSLLRLRSRRAQHLTGADGHWRTSLALALAVLALCTSAAARGGPLRQATGSDGSSWAVSSAGSLGCPWLAPGTGAAWLPGLGVTT